MPEPVRLADADPPITSLDDPRVPERVRWAVERLAVRVLARLAREASERSAAPTGSQERRQCAG